MMTKKSTGLAVKIFVSSVGWWTAMSGISGCDDMAVPLGRNDLAPYGAAGAGGGGDASPADSASPVTPDATTDLVPVTPDGADLAPSSSAPDGGDLASPSSNSRVIYLWYADGSPAPSS